MENRECKRNRLREIVTAAFHLDKLNCEDNHKKKNDGGPDDDYR